MCWKIVCYIFETIFILFKKHNHEFWITYSIFLLPLNVWSLLDLVSKRGHYDAHYKIQQEMFEMERIQASKIIAIKYLQYPIFCFNFSFSLLLRSKILKMLQLHFKLKPTKLEVQVHEYCRYSTLNWPYVQNPYSFRFRWSCILSVFTSQITSNRCDCVLLYGATLIKVMIFMPEHWNTM